MMFSFEEFESTNETLHLLRSPENAAMLLQSIRDADAGALIEHDIDE